MIKKFAKHFKKKHTKKTAVKETCMVVSEDAKMQKSYEKIAKKYASALKELSKN